MVTKRVNQSGQAILLVLLAMAVVVTIVLSMLARQVTDTGITNRDEDSIRAFSAAEAGVERRLSDYSLAPLSYSDIPNVSVTGTVSLYGNTRVYEYPFNIKSGDIATIWLAAHDSTSGALTCDDTYGGCFGENVLNGVLSFFWGNPGERSALELTFYYNNGGDSAITSGDFTDVRVVRVPVDTQAGGGNSFIVCPSTSQSLNGKTYACRLRVCVKDFPCLLPGGDTSLNLSSTKRSGLMFVRAKVMYTSIPQPLAVESSSTWGDPLPPQGRLIEASGTSSGNSATRKLSVTNIYSDYPPVLDYGLFVNGGGLTK